VCVRRLRHPNIMLLLGVCQTDLLDGLVLIYERISYGSLHNFLYHTVTSKLTRGFFDPEGGSQSATVVVVLVVIAFLKTPKAFLIRSATQRSFCTHIRAYIPDRSTVSDFKINL